MSWIVLLLANSLHFSSSSASSSSLVCHVLAFLTTALFLFNLVSSSQIITMAPIAISPERDGQLDTLADLTAKFDDTIRFYLNGTKVVLDEIDPEITVLEYLRGIGLTGTKLYDKTPVSTISSRFEAQQ